MKKTKKCIILVGHGAFPLDIPKNEISEYMKLRSLHISGNLDHKNLKKFIELEKKIIYKKRTKNNDPHFYHHKILAKKLEQEIGIKVFIAFNEFCAPLIENLLKDITQEFNKIIVIPTMLTKGYHTDTELREKIEKMKNKKNNIVYIFPFSDKDILSFFLKVSKKYI